MESSRSRHLAYAPPPIRSLIGGYREAKITSGQSGAAVYRLTRPGNRDLILKHTRLAPHGLHGEACRMRWLGSVGERCPDVLAEVSCEQDGWLLMTALDGAPICSEPDLDVARTATWVGQALRSLHSLDADGCPFRDDLDSLLARAAERVRTGVVDEDDFDEQRRGMTGQDVLAWLLASRPVVEDLVVVHGDATFENMIMTREGFVGFVDLGGLGVSDRHRDLALALRSIEDAFGERGLSAFNVAYGLPIDPFRIAYYQTLDELF